MAWLTRAINLNISLYQEHLTLHNSYIYVYTYICDRNLTDFFKFKNSQNLYKFFNNEMCCEGEKNVSKPPVIQSKFQSIC